MQKFLEFFYHLVWDIFAWEYETPKKLPLFSHRLRISRRSPACVDMQIVDLPGRLTHRIHGTCTPQKFNSSPLKSSRNPIGKHYLTQGGELLNFGGGNISLHEWLIFLWQRYCDDRLGVWKKPWELSG